MMSDAAMDNVRQTKWDLRFLSLCRLISSWSKDPSTKVGAVIVDPNQTVVSLGFNGFPRSIRDDPARYHDRDYKYRVIIHAEINALLFASKPVRGCTLYTWPFLPCPRCASLVIQSGISRIVSIEMSESIRSRWGDEIRISSDLFAEAGIPVVIYGGRHDV